MLDLSKNFSAVTGKPLTGDNLGDIKVELQPTGKVMVGITKIEPGKDTYTINNKLITGNPTDNAIVKMDRITTSYTMLEKDGSIDTATMASVKDIAIKAGIMDNNIIAGIGEDNQEVTGEEPLAYIKIQQGTGVVVGSDGQTKTQAFAIDYGTISTSIASSLLSGKSASEVINTIKVKKAQIEALNKSIETTVAKQVKDINEKINEFASLDKTTIKGLDTKDLTKAISDIKDSMIQNFSNNLSQLTKIEDAIKDISSKTWQNQADADKALSDAIGIITSDVGNFQAIKIDSNKTVVTLGLPSEEEKLNKKRDLSVSAIKDLKDKNSILKSKIQGDTPTETELKDILLDNSIPESTKKELLQQRLYMEIYSTGSGNEISLMNYNFAKFVGDNGLTDMFNSLNFTSDTTYDKDSNGKGIKLGNFMKNIVSEGKNMRSDLQSLSSAIDSGKIGGMQWISSGVLNAAKAQKTLYTNSDGSFSGKALSDKISNVLAGKDYNSLTTDQKKGYDMLRDLATKATNYKDVVDLIQDGQMANLDYLAQATGTYNSPDFYANGKPNAGTTIIPPYDSTIKTAYKNNVLGPSNPEAVAAYLVQNQDPVDIQKKLADNKKNNNAPTINTTLGDSGLKLNGINPTQGITMVKSESITKTTATVAINSSSINPGANAGYVGAVIKSVPISQEVGDVKFDEIKTEKFKTPQLPTTYTPDYLPLPIIKDGARTYNLQSKTGLNYVKYGYNSEMTTTIRAVKPLDSNPDIQFDVFLENQ